jgi:hypothetical protein
MGKLNVRLISARGLPEGKDSGRNRYESEPQYLNLLRKIIIIVNNH